MKLGVNIDHVATLRQARLSKDANIRQLPPVYPSPIQAAKICQKLKIHSIVMHLREDRRHIQDDDVRWVREELNIRLNLEMAIAPSVVKLALRTSPEQATLVPEKRQEKTTEGGLDLTRAGKRLGSVIASLAKKNIEVSLFIDPNPSQIRLAKKLNVPSVELHTGDYANHFHASSRQRELNKLKEAAQFAQSLGLNVYAGHGLDYQNLKPILNIRAIQELNIGYSIIARSLWVGFERAVTEMKELIRSSS